MSELNTTGGIKSWAEDDRPREKLLTKGRQALSNAELLAILIGSGTKTISAVELARQLLHESGNSLRTLGAKTIQDLTKPKGMGKVRAITISAALELGRRRASEEPPQKQSIQSSADAYRCLGAFMADLHVEQFWVIYLNRSNHVLACSQVSIGGITGTVADSRIIFREALERRATGLIISHNHPSGNLKPSDQDVRLTRKLIEAGNLLDIAVLDHIIYTDHGYFSFADDGRM